MVALFLLPMIISDYYCRKISIYPLVGFGIFQFWIGSLDDALYNMLLLTLLFGCVWCYLIVRYGKIFFDDYFGCGDALFLLFLTPCFSLSEFVWFLVLGFMFSLFYRSTTIPLVTTLGITYLIWIIYEEILHTNFLVACYSLT